MSLSNIIKRFRRKKMQPYIFQPILPSTQQNNIDTVGTLSNNNNELTQQQTSDEIPDVIHIPATPYYKFSYIVKEQSIKTLQKITPIKLVTKVEKKTLDDYDEVIELPDDFFTFTDYDYCSDIPLEELNKQLAFLPDDYGPPPPYNACHSNPQLPCTTTNPPTLQL